MPLAVQPTNVSGATTINLALAAGEAVAQPVTFTPLDLTGYSLKMQIQFPTPLVLSTGNGGITVVDAAAGQVQINIPSSTSEGFPAGGYPYEFWTISGGGLAERLWTGTFTVLGSFTAIP